jgi:hypothetical protein
MVVDNFNVVAVTVSPNKAYAPLIVDADRVLAGALAS